MDFNKMDFRKAKKISYWIVFSFLLIILIFVSFPLLPIKNNYSLKMVTSGSMSPTIKTGAIVMIKPTLLYKVGDIITFKVGSGKRDIVTHRIISQSKGEFVTQGDANNVADIKLVKKEQILGKVLLTIPYVGYVANVLRSKIAILTLVWLPAILIIISEGRKIKQEIEKKKKNKKDKE